MITDHYRFVVPYNEFDIFVDDINGDDFGVHGFAENLSPSKFPSKPFPVKGHITPSCRLMIPLVVQRAREPNSPCNNIWFLVDISSPYTCFTEKSMKVISPSSVYGGRFAIQDQLSNIDCMISKDHFKNVNILGADALEKLKLSLDIDWDRNTFKLIRQ